MQHQHKKAVHFKRINGIWLNLKYNFNFNYGNYGDKNHHKL